METLPTDLLTMGIFLGIILIGGLIINIIVYMGETRRALKTEDKRRKKNGRRNS